MELPKYTTFISSYKTKRPPKKTKSRIPTSIYDIEGVVTLIIPTSAQKFIECVVDQHVTVEKLWVKVKKEKIIDHIELNDEESVFSSIKKLIFDYSDEDILFGYKPDPNRTEDMFRIVLSVDARNFIQNILNKEQKELDESVQKMLTRSVGYWTSLGSEFEVNDQFGHNRPLYQYHYKVPFPKPGKFMFKMRKVEDARDGYVQLLCDPRFPYETVTKSRTDASFQRGSSLKDQEVQTDYKILQNHFTQYDYQYEQVSAKNKFEEEFKRFSKETQSVIENALVVNNKIDLFFNDYEHLGKNYKPQATFGNMFNLYASISSNICKQEPIADISWNPFVSGIIAVAYVDYTTSMISGKDNSRLKDHVNRATYGWRPVHVWGYDDEIEPKLLLMSKRKVTVLSFCPVKENILVGGTVSGQIVIWDLTNKIERAEKVKVLTQKQSIYRIHLRSMLGKISLIDKKKNVDPIFISSLADSHGGAITNLTWMPSNSRFSSDGKIHNLGPGECSIQFMTVSIDGSVIIWDLAKTFSEKKPTTFMRRKTLMSEIVRLKTINGKYSDLIPIGRTLKPIYKINMHPNNLPMNIVTILRFHSTVDYQPVDPENFDPEPRVRTRFMIDKIKNIEKTPIIVGTAVGTAAKLNWFGYDYEQPVNLLMEDGVAKFYQNIHDGPVVVCSLNNHVKEIIMTVGGSVFAIWHTNEEFPLYWNKAACGVRYHSGTWAARHGSIVLLVRSDGFVDIWNFHNNSCEYVNSYLLGSESMKIFGSLSSSECRKNTFIVANKEGTISIYLEPDYMNRFSDNEQKDVVELFLGRVRTIKHMKTWMEKLSRTYEDIDIIFKKIEYARVSQRRLGFSSDSLFITRQRRMTQIERMNRIFKKKTWKSQGEEDMFNTLMKLKGIQLSELVKYRMPLEDMARTEKARLDKRDQMLRKKNDLFRKGKNALLGTIGRPETIFVPGFSTNNEAFLYYLEDYDLLEENTLRYVEKNQFVSNLTQKENVERRLSSTFYSDVLDVNSDIVRDSSLFVSCESLAFTDEYKVANIRDLFKNDE